MKKNWAKAFKIEINNCIATIDVACFDNVKFVCLFNIEKHKDFVNGFKARGFQVSITSMGDRQVHYFPFKLSASSALTEEVMKDIWDKIERELKKEHKSKI